MTKKTVIIADDAKVMRILLTSCFDDSEYEIVAQACDGQEAINHYKKQPSDFVFLDIVMPNVDGMQALEEIIAINPQAKVIMASSMGSESMFEKALNIGATGFVIKPYDKGAILSTLKDIA